MTVRLQFFSRLKEVAGSAHRELELPDGATVADLLTKLYALTPELRSFDSSLLIGAGVEFVGRDYKLREGEEISLMPPVQGG
jgi:molybdopterin converting factor small subunit